MEPFGERSLRQTLLDSEPSNLDSQFRIDTLFLVGFPEGGILKLFFQVILKTPHTLHNSIPPRSTRVVKSSMHRCARVSSSSGTAAVFLTNPCVTIMRLP